jgi:ABC-type ATPase involved in cell division/GNAT superfamily N-acetyltransferase
MPNFNHIVESDYKASFRTEKVVGMFDVPVQKKLSRQWEVNIPIEEKEWQIGLIVGASGSGKTTLAKRLFGKASYHKGFRWSKPSLLDDFSEKLDVKDITDALSHVGFSSPPAWLLPFKVLSNGEKFRAEIARLVLEGGDLSVLDEFTSVVDRTVAKIGSHAMQKFVRRGKGKFVAVSCHYDIAEWLQPDWIYDVSTETFSWGCLRRSAIEVEVFQCHSKAWRIFRGHHYLSRDLNPSAKCFIAMIEGQPAGFCSVLPFPHATAKGIRKEHRTVVLPDFQGIGLGVRLSECVGQHYRDQGLRFRSVTSHPAMIGHRARSLLWKMDRPPSRLPKAGRTGNRKMVTSSKRLTASFEYFGKKE